MATHVFTVVLDRRPTDDEVDELFAAGCDDASFGVEHGLSIAQFDRAARLWLMRLRRRCGRSSRSGSSFSGLLTKIC
jgi:hypothetical protein